MPREFVMCLGLLAIVTSTIGCAGSTVSEQSTAQAIPTAPPVSEAPAVTKSEESPAPYPAAMGTVDADAPQEFTKTASGLEYKILRKSEGRKPTSTDTVEVHYHGWLDNGKVFDSSYNRNESISFPLNGVIAGWTEGMQLVGEGGMIELSIPPELGYGAQGAGGAVPPNARLHFLVELLSVK